MCTKIHFLSRKQPAFNSRLARPRFLNQCNHTQFPLTRPIGPQALLGLSTEHAFEITFFAIYRIWANQPKQANPPAERCIRPSSVRISLMVDDLNRRPDKVNPRPTRPAPRTQLSLRALRVLRGEQHSERYVRERAASIQRRGLPCRRRPRRSRSDNRPRHAPARTGRCKEPRRQRPAVVPGQRRRAGAHCSVVQRPRPV
jgi:hypothetical protein